MPQPQRGAPLPYRLLAGVIACPGGWLVAGAKLQGVTTAPEEPYVVRTFLEVLDSRPAYNVMALAAPIGLPDEPTPGGRACDREARRLVGRRRGGAIVSPPSRAELAILQEGSGDVHLSAVARRLAPRYREVDDALSPYWQRTVFEVHPELSFLQLNGDAPMRFPKHSKDGIEERRALLEARLPGAVKILDARGRGMDRAHLIDACAGLWTARRIAARAVSRVPEDPVWDSKGLRMEMVR